MTSLDEWQTFYMMLDSTKKMIPDDADPWVLEHYQTILEDVRGKIARLTDPKTMTNIREYRGDPHPRDDWELADWLVGRLIEQVHDAERDPGFEWYAYPAQIGFDEVLEAPVESAAEFLEWMLKRHREKFDGMPCDGCGEPLPYDERHRIAGPDRVGYFHEFCYAKVLREMQAEPQES
jgi:hypothetical protein